MNYETPKKSFNSSMRQSIVFSPKNTKYGKFAFVTEDTSILKELNLPAVWTDVLPHYKLTRKIGSGTYGTVVGASCKVTGEKVAIKHIKDFSLYEYDCCKLIREI